MLDQQSPPPLQNGEKKEEVKANSVYAFTKDELVFLEPRQYIFNEYKLLMGDVEFVMQQFILRNVIPRLRIDPAKDQIEYDIGKNIISIKPKIIVPPSANSKIIVPK